MIGYMTAMSVFLFALAGVAASQPSPGVPGADHDTLGECYDYVVNQYNQNGDAEGLEWGMDNCDEAYEEMIVRAPVGQLEALRTSKTQEALRKRPPMTQLQWGSPLR